MKADRELDAQVAEKVMPSIVGKYPYYSEHNGKGYVRTSKYSRAIRWSPSTDIKAALPVLEKAKKSFFSTTITMWDHTDKVAIVGDKRQGHNENISVLTVQAETLPLAICKFALRTKENENE